MKRALIGIFGSVLLLAGLLYAGTAIPSPENLVGSYVTSTQGRTKSQIHNVKLACKRMDNTVLLPGQTFSFNGVVGTWTADRGYVKAPVSYDGELVRSYGGGVCQASSTLYNAALLAGLEIVQRERHHFAPRYVPPGRDAAVAYKEIDLKFCNNLPEPIRIRATVQNTGVICRIYSAYQPDYKVYVQSDMKEISRPSEIVSERSDSPNTLRKLVNRGHAGFNVVTYRSIVYPDRTVRQRVADDKYPAMNRVVHVVEM